MLAGRLLGLRHAGSALRRLPVTRVAPLSQIRKLSSDIKDIKEESDTNENDSSASLTGVIDQEKTDVLIYFDQLYELSSFRSTFKRAIKDRFMPSDKSSVKEHSDNIERALSPIPPLVKITECIPLKRYDGAFVKFCVPANLDSKDFIHVINKNIDHNNAEKNKNFFHHMISLVVDNKPKIFTVKGTPWIEDLKRYPSPKIRVKYEGNPLTEEELYLLFRRYGRIVDIFPDKDSAMILFKSADSAICAKHCVTGISLNKGQTTLHLQFVPIKRFGWIVDALVNHQKISIPIIIALMAGVAVLIFDPVREWFIESKITKKYALETYINNRYVQLLLLPYNTLVSWLTEGYDYLDDQITSKFQMSSAPNDDFLVENLNINMLWTERFEKSKQLQLWIHENINTFIIVKGPKGSGKEEFVLEHTLNGDTSLKNLVLSIDCDKLIKSRTDSLLLDNTAFELGYFPVFTWTNSISQFIDLAVQGLTGQKSGLSESKEIQIKNMFSLSNSAIRNIALVKYQKYVDSINKRNSRLERNGEALIDVLSEDEYIQQHPESKPIIVINKFARKSHDSSSNDFMYQVIAEWTAGLIQNNLAHVIYTTSDVGSIQHLTEALPNQVFKTVSLSDATTLGSKQFLMNQLRLKDSSFIDECFEPLGGRMLDLQAIVRRIKSGETPSEALEEMISQSAEQITTFFLNNAENSAEKNWSPAQVWSLMKILSETDCVNYEDLVKSPLFGYSNDAAETLGTLEKYDLIALRRENGVLDQILTGRPIYKAAFKKLINDEKIFKLYEVDYFTKLIKIENDKITKFENELITIYKLGDKLGSRIAYLADKIETSNSKVTNYESKIIEINQPGSRSSKSWYKF